MNNKHIIEYLDNYINSDNINSTVLLNGVLKTLLMTNL